MPITKRYVSAFVISIAAVFCHGPAAQAQSQEQLDWCNGKKDIATPDLGIGGCTAAIQSGKTTGKDLAVFFNNRGIHHKNKGEYDRAIQDYNQALKIDPQYALSFNNRGNAYNSKGQHDRAIQDYDQAIKINPQYASAFFNRGNTYNSKGQHDRAIQDYDQAIKINPQSANAFLNRGVVYNSKGQFDRAIQDYDQAIKLEPSAVLFTNRGVAYNSKGQFDRAIQDYDQAIKLDPNYADAFTNRGVAWVNKKDYDHAIADYSEAIRLNPNSALAFTNRGSAWSNKKDYDRAVADYTEAIRLKGNDAFADLIGRASVYRESGNFSAALDDLERAKMLIASYRGSDPSPRMTYYFNKGRTLHAMGNYDAAIAAFSAGMPEQPDYYWVYYNRALSYEKTGQRDKTVEDLKTLATHTEQKNWSEEIKAKLAQY